MKPVKQFYIAIGRKNNFISKFYETDCGTPEGIYSITEILSLNVNTNSESYQKLKKLNMVYFYAKDGNHLWGFPQKDEGRNAYGPRFFRLDYPNEKDIDRYNGMKKKGLIPKGSDGKVKGPGWGIGIHGTCDPNSIKNKISSGCIRLNNREVVQLDSYIELGTPVYIEK